MLLNGHEGWETVQRPFNLIDPHYLSQLLSRTGKGPFGPDLEQYKKKDS